MKILHCCLSAFYLDNYNYQENLLSEQNKKDGHEVKIIASTFAYENNDNKKGIYLKPRKYVNEHGISIERYEFKRFFFSILTNNIRIIKGLYNLIDDFSPDVILFHGTSSLDIKTVVKYKMTHPQVKLYLDSHTDYYTSGTNFLSKYILHGLIYRRYLTKALPYIEKILYVSIGCGSFLKEIYKIPENKIEFFSLGGYIPSEEEIENSKKKIKLLYNIENDKIIILQAGKLDRNKKVVESLNTFKKVNSNRYIYLLIGSLSEDIKHEVDKLIKTDSRVKYLGWKKANELNIYLNACDIYIQPGKVSAIAQNAICRSSVVILNDLKEYQPFVKGNGWLIKDIDDIKNIFDEIDEDNKIIRKKKEIAKDIANKYFDYKKLAERLYR